MNPSKRLVIMTGELGVGKTTLCLRLAEALRQRGDSVAGLITRRTGPHSLEALDLAKGIAYPLTRPYDPQRRGELLPHFQFDPRAMDASAQAFLCGFPARVFFLDEIGPLELLYGQGWVSLFEALLELDYRWGVIVVRQELLEAALQRLPGPPFTVTPVDETNRDARFDELLALLTEES